MRKLNKTQRYIETLGPIGRHVKGERNLHPYASLNNQQSAKGVRDSARGKNLSRPFLRTLKTKTVVPME